MTESSACCLASAQSLTSDSKCTAPRWRMQCAALVDAVRCVGRCSALRWQMQCAALADAVRRVGGCSAPRWGVGADARRTAWPHILAAGLARCPVRAQVRYGGGGTGHWPKCAHRGIMRWRAEGQATQHKTNRCRLPRQPPARHSHRSRTAHQPNAARTTWLPARQTSCHPPSAHALAR